MFALRNAQDTRAPWTIKNAKDLKTDWRENHVLAFFLVVAIITNLSTFAGAKVQLFSKPQQRKNIIDKSVAPNITNQWLSEQVHHAAGVLNTIQGAAQCGDMEHICQVLSERANHAVGVINTIQGAAAVWCCGTYSSICLSERGDIGCLCVAVDYMIDSVGCVSPVSDRLSVWAVGCTTLRVVLCAPLARLASPTLFCCLLLKAKLPMSFGSLIGSFIYVVIANPALRSSGLQIRLSGAQHP